MSPWSEIEIAVPGSRLRAYRTGRPGAPQVLLVHGLTDNAHYWRRTVDALARDYDLALYDARGHGQSGPLPAPFDESVRVSDLLQVVETLGLQRPALIGHSMGAATVAAAAAQQPGLARGVVVEDPPWVDQPLSEPALRAYMAGWKTDLLKLRGLSRAAALALRQSEQPDWSAVDHTLSLDARQQVDPRVLDLYTQARTPWREVVRAIGCPLLLLTGENARGAYVTPALAREAASLWRAGQWVHLDGAGHSARYSRFEPYLAAVKHFLSTV
jgi:pimeloyl-ACP methyl ester carboxylesterase